MADPDRPAPSPAATSGGRRRCRFAAGTRRPRPSCPTCRWSRGDHLLHAVVHEEPPDQAAPVAHTGIDRTVMVYRAHRTDMAESGTAL